MMRIFNAKARITIGLVGIVVSLVMLASFFKIIPDQYSADIKRRTALAETVAVYSTALVKTARVQRLQDDFALLVERNEDLLSLALRHENGKVLVATEGHDADWLQLSGEFSTTSHVKVPIWSGKDKWGQLELRFSPLVAGGLFGVFSRPIVQLSLFMGLLSFVIYYFYLGRVLRQLDPSQAIPSRVRSALDTMAEGLLILDRKEQIVLANQAFSSMVDKPAEELLGFRAGELPWTDSHGESVPKANRPWVVALAAGAVQRDSTIRLLMPDGCYRTFKTNCSPVLGDKSKYAGVLISFDDITELEQKEIELRNSKLEAEEANKAKSSFLANMSHEIRTPMNAILGFTDILKRGYVKNEQQSLKYLNTIHSSGKNLLELINDILDLSKVESGRLEVETLAVKPYQVIHEVVEMLRVKADEKGIRLSFKVTTEMPEEIETDPVRLRQIAFNLIGNSIKFTEAGEVSVSCRLEGTAEQQRFILDIKDTGIGMSEEAQQKVFDPFTQADSSVTRQFGGTGLGLAISQRFAKALGGDIRVESKLGVGSTFSVALATGSLAGVKFLCPGEIEAQYETLEATTATRWSFPEAQVLVVDDGAENRELITLLLTDAGLTVVEAENGREALEQTRQQVFDVILMDINMPVMDGYEAATEMRSAGCEAPIVALTANAMKGDEDKCFAAGYSDYLSKPINIDNFMDLIAKLLGGKEVEKTEISPPVESADPVAVPEPRIHSTLPVNNEKFRLIVARFLNRLPKLLEEMEIAYRDHNYIDLVSLAHRLKGSGGTVGFDVFTAPATRLENFAKDENREAVRDSLDEISNLAERVVEKEAASGAAATVKNSPDVHYETTTVESQPLHSSEMVVSRLAENIRMQPIIRNFVKTLEQKLLLMEKALGAQDYSAMADLGHWLKGAGGTVGFDAFTDIAAKFENTAKENNLQQTEDCYRAIKDITARIVVPGEEDQSLEKRNIEVG